MPSHFPSCRTPTISVRYPPPLAIVFAILRYRLTYQIQYVLIRASEPKQCKDSGEFDTIQGTPRLEGRCISAQESSGNLPDRWRRFFLRTAQNAPRKACGQFAGGGMHVSVPGAIGRHSRPAVRRISPQGMLAARQAGRHRTDGPPLQRKLVGLVFPLRQPRSTEVPAVLSADPGTVRPCGHPDRPGPGRMPGRTGGPALRRSRLRRIRRRDPE